MPLEASPVTNSLSSMNSSYPRRAIEASSDCKAYAKHLSLIDFFNVELIADTGHMNSVLELRFVDTHNRNVVRIPS